MADLNDRAAEHNKKVAARNELLDKRAAEHKDHRVPVSTADVIAYVIAQDKQMPLPKLDKFLSIC